MLKQMLTISAVAVAGIYGYKHRAQIKNFLGFGGAATQGAITQQQAIQLQLEMEKEVQMYKQMFKDPSISLSPYQKCIKKGFISSAISFNPNAAGAVISRCKVEHNVK